MIEVGYTLGAVEQYTILTLITVLAWPARTIREMATRALVCAPLVIVAVPLEVSSTLLAGLWAHVNHELPSVSSGWIVWGEFLAGGGGLITAVVIAIACIGLATPHSKTSVNLSP
jgi:hypothetical protein